MAWKLFLEELRLSVGQNTVDEDILWSKSTYIPIVAPWVSSGSPLGLVILIPFLLARALKLITASSVVNSTSKIFMGTKKD
jgi:hypothetical protein